MEGRFQTNFILHSSPYTAALQYDEFIVQCTHSVHSSILIICHCFPTMIHLQGGPKKLATIKYHH